MKIGNAESAHFTTDIGLGKDDLNTAVALFFAFFVTLQPVGAALGRRYGMKTWTPSCMLLWGVATALHVWVRERWQLYTLRVAIGCLEGMCSSQHIYVQDMANVWWLQLVSTPLLCRISVSSTRASSLDDVSVCSMDRRLLGVRWEASSVILCFHDFRTELRMGKELRRNWIRDGGRGRCCFCLRAV